MKALQLQKGLILREFMRLLDRDENSIEFRFKIEVKYGSTLTEKLAKETKEVSVVVTNENNPITWKKCKDISTGELMEFILANKDFKLEYIKDECGGVKEITNPDEFELLIPFIDGLFEALKPFSKPTLTDI